MENGEDENNQNLNSNNIQNENSENINNENQNNEITENENENEKEYEIKEPIREKVIRIFHNEKVNTYYNNQKPNLSNNKFTDEFFLPNNDSLFNKGIKNELTNEINMNEIEWKRISDIFTSENLTLFPLINENNEIEFQINIKDNISEKLNKLYSNFYHAISLLTSYPNLIEKIFKTKKINKDGLYELYIYYNGEYQILLIDDYFPFIKNKNKLLFSKPKNEEIWLLLLEKAYAKVNGGYGSLFNCDINSILILFTGFSCERLNLFDIDDEDLDNIIRINKLNNLIFVYPSDEGEKNGIIKNKSYQLIEIFDIRINNENGNEDCLKLIKLRNLFDYQSYKGDYCPSSELLNEDIKRIINYNPEEKEVIYMSLENLKTNFSKITIMHIMFNCNIKIITIKNNNNDDSIIGTPQVFNLYLPSSTKISFSLIIKNNKYENVERLTPSNICISKYEPEEKKLMNFEGSFNSNENCEFARELDEGYYIIWTYLLKEKCSVIPNEYDLKVSSNIYFKLKHQIQDIKFHLIKQMIYNAILQYQGEFIKEDEIYMMEDNYYNYSGFGLKVIINPFNYCYQKWIFQNNMNNMYLLYPYSKIKQFEFILLPNNYCLLLSMKIDNNKKCEFNMKSYFKTLKYKNQELPNLNNSDFDFIEYCSKEVKEEEINFSYYNYLTDEGIKKSEGDFNRDKIILDHLSNKYPEQMKLIEELNILNPENESNLHFIEKSDLDGVYIGQINNNGEREGRGCFISNNNNNNFIGYWKNDLKTLNGKLYDKDFKLMLNGNFINGKMNGKGMKIFDNGDKYEGNFEDDKINGFGIYYFNNGNQWEGNFINGNKNGIGKFTDSNGNVKEVEYKNDVLVNNNNDGEN